MKNDKKKIVFIGAILLTVSFILGYYFLVLNKTTADTGVLHQVAVPELSASDSQSFTTKKEAIDAIEEKRERIAPSVYDDRLLDSLGRFDRDLMDKEKQRMVDSIYRMGRIDYSDETYTPKIVPKKTLLKRKVNDTIAMEVDSIGKLKKMGLEQQLFFAVSPQVDALTSGQRIRVAIDGKQTVKVNDRLRLRCLADGEIQGIPIVKNTLIYGIVTFRPNRVVLEVSNIGHRPIQLSAFDLADGLEGIYIRNSFRGEVFKEVLGDVIEDINVPGVPQVSGIQKVFQRNNRNVKVIVSNNYELLLISK